MLLVFPAAKNPAYESLSVNAAGQAELDLLTDEYAAVLNALQNPPATNPAPPAASAFDDQGRPLNQFFSVFEYRYDSDLDGIWNHDELAAGTDLDPYTPAAVPEVYRLIDTDGDGTPNAEEVDGTSASDHHGDHGD